MRFVEGPSGVIHYLLPSDSFSSRSCALVNVGAISSASKTCFFASSRLPGLQQRLREIGMRAGLVERLGRKRDAKQPHRFGGVAAVHAPFGRTLVWAWPSNGSTDTTRFSAVCILAASLGSSSVTSWRADATSVWL